MSWGTYYVKMDGYASRQSAASAASDAEDRREWLERLWQRILILMATSPHAVKDDDGHSQRWTDYIEGEFREIKEQMEEYYCDLHRLSDVAEAHDEEYAIITYCKNGHAHFRHAEYHDDDCKTCCDCGAEIVGCCRMKVCDEG